MREQSRVDAAAGWYLDGQLDMDRTLIRLRFQSLQPYLRGPRGLEVGPAEGQMTRLLVSRFKELTVVEAALDLLKRIPAAGNLIKVHSLFERFEPKRLFNTIVMDHILEHVARPVEMLVRAKAMLAPGGRLLAGVPNARSIHRLVGVKMGLLRRPTQLNDRDRAQGHRRVYTRDTFEADLRRAGFRVREMQGIFFKPLSNQQMQDHWSPEMILGFYELGKDFPEHAAEIFAVCSA